MKCNSWNRIIANLEPSPTLSYILGVLKGDGSVYIRKKPHRTGEIQLEVKDKIFAESFFSALKDVGLNPNIWHDNEGFWHAKAYSLHFARWVKSLPLDNLFQIMDRTKENLFEFFRGLYESDGTLTERLAITNSDGSLLRGLQERMATWGFYFHLFSWVPKRSPTKKPSYVLSLYEPHQVTSLLKELSLCIERKKDVNHFLQRRISELQRRRVHYQKNRDYVLALQRKRRAMLREVKRRATGHRD